jgi:hypothetical protein
MPRAVIQQAKPMPAGSQYTTAYKTMMVDMRMLSIPAVNVNDTNGG